MCFEGVPNLNSLLVLDLGSDLLSYSLLLWRMEKDRRSVLYTVSYEDPRSAPAYGFPYQDPVGRR
jgi:hypothetical protein